MGQIVGKVSNIFRCNLLAIQSGGSQANTVLAADEVWLIDTTNSLTNSLSGNCDAYIVGDGTTAAKQLELKSVVDWEHITVTTEGTDGVFDICDDNYNVICRIKDGYIITAKFDGKEIKEHIDKLQCSESKLFSGKKVSVIGDSISTFFKSGYYYPDYSSNMQYPSLDVLNVEDTWWYKVIYGNDGIFEVNKSYAGAFVTSHYGDYRPSFYGNIGSLGNPDIILINLGLNDSYNLSLEGEYDYNKTIDSYDETKFIEAYIKGVRGLKRDYPNAKIICIIQTGIKDSFAEAIINIAKHYSLQFADLHNYQDVISRPDGIHPNGQGMMGMANTITSLIYHQSTLSKLSKSISEIESNVTMLIESDARQDEEAATHAKTEGSSTSELDIIDGNYNCLVRFKNGHIYLANFNSEDLEGLSYEGVVNLIQDKIDGLNVPIVTDDSTLAEIDFCDDSRNVVLRLKNGHIYTARFNSEDVTNTISILENKTDEQREEYVAIRDKHVDEIMNMKLEDWSELQFGMFIHWGVYSAWAGHWDGGTDRYGNTVGEYNNGGEWMYRNSQMPEDVYKSKQSEFTASNWDTDRLCQLAKSIGMKYIIITARHHDGFALYKSDNEPWNIDTSAAPNDVLMKLKNSCDKYGIKFGLYISTFRNWTEEGGYDQSWTVLPNRDPYTEEQHLAFASKQIVILKELYDTYHPFEFWGDGESAISDDVAKLQNSYMPFVFTNERGGFHSRFGSVENNIAVYDDICTYKRERCKYFQIAWGYNEGDESYSRLKPFSQELWNMLTALSRGYNILENVGPKADGSLPDAVLTWLGYLRDWCNKYFHFNGCKRIATLSNYPWGRIVNKGDSVYCIIIDGNNTISVDGVDVSNFKGAHVYGISNPDDVTNYQIDVENNKIVINNLPTGVTAADPFHVVRLDFNGTPVFMDYFDTSGNIPAKTFMADTGSAETRVEINWNQSSNVRLMNPSSSAASYTPALFSFVTRFRWTGDSDDYSIGASIGFNNMYGTVSNPREGITGTQTLRVELYNEYEEVPFFSNEEIQLTDNGDILSSTSKVRLTEGRIYKMRVVVSTDATFVAGMAEKIDNFSFEK